MSKEKLFISYSRQDSKRVKVVVDYLISKNIKVWFDQVDIVFGNDIVERINKALSECQYFVIFASKNYFANEWTKAEYQAATYLALSFKTLSILVVRLDDVTLPPLIAASAYLSLDKTDNISQEIENVIKSTLVLHSWETLSEQMFHIIIPEIFKNLGMLKRQEQDEVTLEIKSYPPSTILIQFSKSLLHNEVLMADLDTEWQIYEAHKFHINYFTKELREGGLGILSPAYELKLQKRQKQLSESRANIISQFSFIAPHIWIH